MHFSYNAVQKGHTFPLPTNGSFKYVLNTTIDILTFACEKKAAIITADVGFGSLVYFSNIEHFGIILLRLPVDTPVKKINETLVNALLRISPDEIAGSIIVVDRQKIRIRRKK